MEQATLQLRIESGPDVGRTFSLEKPSLTIGRYPLADIVIDEPDIAYRHAVLTRSEDTYQIADLGSDSGTFVNGMRIELNPVRLQPGDMIMLGLQTIVAFRHEAQTEDIDTESHEDIHWLSAEVSTGSEPADDGQIVTSRSSIAPGSPSVGEVGTPTELLPEEIPTADNLASNTVFPAAETPASPGPNVTRTATESYESASGNKNNRRFALIAAGCVLLMLLACCCSSTLFLYYIGGDWLLRQLGIL